MRNETQTRTTTRKFAPVVTRRLLDRLPATVPVIDAVVIVGVMALAGVIRMGLGITGAPLEIASIHAAPVIAVTWLASIGMLGGYRERFFGAGMTEYKAVVNATFLTVGVTGVGAYLLQFALSRSFFVLVFPLGVVGLVVSRRLLRRAIHRARRAGAMGHDALLVGAPSNVDEIASVLSRESWLGYRVLGALVPVEDTNEETVRGVPILGTPEQATEVIGLMGADVVFLVGGTRTSAAEIKDLVRALEHDNVQVIVAPSVTDVASDRITVRPVAGLPLVHIDPPRYNRARQRAKRAFDVLAAFALILAIAPLMLAIALWIKIYDRGPVMFQQTRTGLDGEEFPCLKFRSMVTDAEARLADLHEAEGYDGVGMFKAKHDPRVTAPGRLLRRLSLDELPQLFNVVRGEMSLVGPRPPLPSEVATYDPATRRRLHVRPGITGLWQVSGRSDLSWDETVRLDLYYVDNWSMLQDLAILLRTFKAVLGSKGAY
jgi:exopolysaccharide biosynthesis polyprenyl glycosylphosphotransferase